MKPQTLPLNSNPSSWPFELILLSTQRKSIHPSHACPTKPIS
jgi:hypothetical protein